MQTIDEDRLESDPTYRYEYLAEFIGFDAEADRFVAFCEKRRQLAVGA